MTHPNRCRRCAQRLVRPDENAHLTRPRLIQVHQDEAMMRCACGAWCPLPDVLRGIFVAVLRVECGMLDTVEDL